ncbi:iron-containing alcohol dehydrogenase [Paraburkholderia sp. LEh10]|uniref:iron-containing alcohol dehydrogenase n=1 Tax=Paraburkholderia sp. LEh10 TaxID=2821353 RepID=UPI001AE47C1A|nr:iron-containing alcohol dehydrogenase [Paraburkholderia sp. LEh10]MBP0594909.1 iron-containing alcohol dehydrogenase [Paraburkholderia sp. LEh10]
MEERLVRPSGSFVLEQRSHRVVFGRPISDVLTTELAALGFERILLVTTPGNETLLQGLIVRSMPGISLYTFTEVVPHVPEHVVEKGIRFAEEIRADGIIAFGGGSSLDTAKAISHKIGVSILAIPTNFSGSEVTPNFGISSDGFKRGVFDNAVLPRTVIYDPSLLNTLPDSVAVCSGINAVAHAVEAMYAPEANPLTVSLAETGIRKMIAGLRKRDNKEAWTIDAFTGSWLCGEVLSQVGMGLHHRICHVLGGSFGLPHAEVHTIVLPYSIAFNFDHTPVLKSLTDLFPNQTLWAGMAAFSTSLGAPASLKDVGFSKDGIEEAVQLAMRGAIANPREVGEADIRSIIQQAFAGELVR